MEISLFYLRGVQFNLLFIKTNYKKINEYDFYKISSTRENSGDEYSTISLNVIHSLSEELVGGESIYRKEKGSSLCK